ncbi:DsbA family protein [Roseovarius sp. D22-M7]|uniref:DsbA family protein n=1 Tax=Roseovarius sp. D22-M7 TaxID=3127116 RepID=UPI00300FC4F4
MRKKIITRIVVALSLALPLQAAAQDLSEDRVRELVLETIRENPEIVMEAVAIFEARQAEAQAASQAEVLDEERETLELDPNAPVLGNPEGDVTVVEFFDYNCPYCRLAKPEIEALLAADPNVRLVYREWPILGEGSVFAARAALASREKSLYEKFHWVMMGMNGRAEETSVLRIAEEIGLEIQQLRRDMDAQEIDAHIQTSMRLAQAVGITATPSFVVGDALVPGVVDADQLRPLVSDAREPEQ